VFLFLSQEGMTMLKFGTAAAAGLAALLLGGQVARAQDDTVRLGTNVQSKTNVLSYDGVSETTLMRGARGFVGGRGGFVGHHGGYYGGYRGGYYGGYRNNFRVNVGFYGGGYGGYGGYYGGYYSPYYSSYYSPYNYGYSPYIYSSPAYYAPYCAPTVYYTPTYSTYVVSGVQGGQQQPPAAYRPAAQVIPVQPTPLIPMKPADGGTYPYDGGPANPVPLPKDGQSYYQPGNGGTGDGRLVGLPVGQKFAPQTSGNFAYPAYGDNLQRTTFATDRTGTKK
jgi:hypothetical protein